MDTSPLPSSTSAFGLDEARTLLQLACATGAQVVWQGGGNPLAIRLPETLARLHGLAGEGPWPLARLLDAYPPSAGVLIGDAFEACVRHGAGFDVAVSLRGDDGQLYRLRWCGLRLAHDGAARLAGVLRDESTEWRERRQQQFQHRHLAAIAAGRPLGEVLEALLVDFETEHPGALGSVLLLEQGSGQLRHAAGARLPEAYREAIDGVCIGEGVGSCGTAAHRRARVVVGDIARDPLWRDYAALAERHALGACWSTPVLDELGRVVATFAIYYREPRLPTIQELAEIDAAVALVGLAVEQAALLENLRQLMDSAVEVICIFDQNGRFVTVNRAAFDVWGYSPEELVGQRVDLLVHPADLPGTLAEMARVMSGEPTRDFGNRNVARDGRVLEMQWSASWSPQNRRMYCYGRDVTRQRAAQDQLRLLERAMETSRNGVLICDALAGDMPILYANAALQRITGYTREEMLGRNCRFLQGDDHDQPALQHLREALREGSECGVVLRNYRKDGSLFWNELNIAPVRDASGKASHFLGVVMDVSERLRFEHELARAVSHDAVTDLPRYAALDALQAQALGAARDTGQRWSLLFIDIDRFHAVNETMGDQVGDRVLRQLAERLRETLGAVGRLSRFAGDEFVAMVPGLDAEGVLALADRLRRAVAQPVHDPGYELCLTASIGISSYPDNGQSPGELLRRAEAAMAQAKREGRDGVCVYSESGMREFEDRLALGVHLRGAIERDELVLHYQPQIETRSGRLVGFEALVRWTDSPLGAVPPGRFIPIAEALGLMPDVGRRVLQHACRQLACWRDAGHDRLVLAINISAQQLLRPEFAAQLEEELLRSRVDASQLQIEVTESSLMENVQRVRRTLDQLHALGLSLALDDFGTGYSSLAYLKRFAFDKLKIDRSFVADIGANSNDAAIARTIVAIGHQLGMRVAAEGVETASQLQLLRALGCDELQGYLLGRPQPAEAFAALLVEGRVALDRPASP